MCRSMRWTRSSARLAEPGTARLASATTVPVGATMRLAPSSVEVWWEPAWFACTHHWLLVSASAG